MCDDAENGTANHYRGCGQRKEGIYPNESQPLLSNEEVRETSKRELVSAHSNSGDYPKYFDDASDQVCCTHDNVESDKLGHVICHVV